MSRREDQQQQRRSSPPSPPLRRPSCRYLAQHDVPGNRIGNDFIASTPYDVLYSDPPSAARRDGQQQTTQRQQQQRRLIRVNAQDPESSGYYDRHGKLVQMTKVTSSNTPRKYACRTASEWNTKRSHDERFLSTVSYSERGCPVPDRILGLAERVNHPQSSARWDDRKNIIRNK